MQNPNQKSNISIHLFTDFILDVGVFLMASGAHCGRVASNIERFAEAWGFHADINPTYTGLTVSVYEKNNPTNMVTQYKSTPAQKVNLNVLTEVSRLSWEAMELDLSPEEALTRFEAIKEQPGYDYRVMSIAVGLACACLCLLAGGNYLNMLLTFAAACAGSLLRFAILKMKFNLMISVVIAAFVTTMIAGLGVIYHIGTSPEAALAMSVLYLIPGVPMLNTIIDLIEGYLSSSLARGLFSSFVLLCIAAGMTLGITLLGIGHF